MARAETVIYDCKSLGPGWIGLALCNGVCESVALPSTEAEVGDYFAARFAKASLKRQRLAELDDLIALAEGKITHYPHPYRAAGTEFQRAVWQGLLAIPAGQTHSYQQLAAAINRPKATRAVGSGCGANPLAVIIPCHRVTRADGHLGGFYWGLDWKRYLLAQEALTSNTSAAR